VSRRTESDQTDRNASARSAGEERLARARGDAAQLAAGEPLLLRILTALVERPATTTDLVKKLGTAQASTSRKLSEMQRDGLVTKERIDVDRRRRLYTVTRDGRALLGRHRALAAPRPEHLPEVPEARREVYLRGALEEALRVRRTKNRLDLTADRLRVVLERADAIHADELAIDATAELATTLRQDREHEQLTPLLKRLERVSVGQDGASAKTALPAFAHHAYVLGRLKVRSDEELFAGRDHLRTAITAYHQLAETPPYGSRRDWKYREAWSVISLGDNFRRRSDYESAFRQSYDALDMFRELNEPYGITRGWMQTGFCLRLMGNFEVAERCFVIARQLANEHSFERFHADALMHIGEVHRCSGDLDAAEGALVEAISRAEALQLTTLQAFAQSSLGAVAHQRADPGKAQIALDHAYDLFEAIDHREGMALTRRRRAAVARRMLVEDVGDVSGVKKLLQSARALYDDLRSPAGLAACTVESGRLALMSHKSKSVAEAVGLLTGKLENSDSRWLIERDPWAPEMLASFATDANAEDLTRRAEEVVTNAVERRGDEKETLGSAVAKAVRSSDAAGVPDPPQPRTTVDPPPALVAEMGSETRRECGFAPQVA
jgi:DNA-binding MarR family transcriptional regulator